MRVHDQAKRKKKKKEKPIQNFDAYKSEISRELLQVCVGNPPKQNLSKSQSDNDRDDIRGLEGPVGPITSHESQTSGHQ